MAQFPVVHDAQLIKARAPSFEQLIKNEEAQIFTDPKTDQVFKYTAFSAAVTKYGYGGLTHLSELLMIHTLNHLFGKAPKTIANTQISREQGRILEFCTPESKTSVDYILLVGVLLCAHDSQEDQIFELWHLANKELEITIDADTMTQFVTALAQIAIVRS